MDDRLDPLETRKDTLQEVIESGADHVGNIMQIVVGAVRDTTRELGDWATDVFEIRDAARRARGEGDADQPAPESPGPPEPTDAERPPHEHPGAPEDADADRTS